MLRLSSSSPGLARDALAQLPLAHQRPERDDERQGQGAGDVGNHLFAGDCCGS